MLLLQALAALEALGDGDHLGADAGLLASVFRVGDVQRDRELGDPVVAGFDAAAWTGEETIARVVDNARAARHGWTGPASRAAGTPSRSWRATASGRSR